LVNYLETPENFQNYFAEVGLKQVKYVDITQNTWASAKRLYRFYFLAKMYLFWKKISFSYKTTPIQLGNILACKYQYLGMKKKLWGYGIVCGTKL
jgi:hypothetical protein